MTSRPLPWFAAALAALLLSACGDVSGDSAVDLTLEIAELVAPLSSDMETDPDPAVQASAEAMRKAQEEYDSLEPVRRVLDQSFPELDDIEQAIDLSPANGGLRAKKAAALVEAGKDPAIAKGELLYLAKRFERFPDEGEERFLKTYLESLQNRICPECRVDPAGQKRLLAEYCANVRLYEDKYPSVFGDAVEAGSLDPELVDSCI